MARVSVNGREMGTLWKAPFRLEITPALQPGENRLEIAVANLWLNRLIGDQALPPESRVAWTTWNPFARDSPLLNPASAPSPSCGRGGVEFVDVYQSSRRKSRARKWTNLTLASPGIFRLLAG
jgi:hypothetical protein